MAPAIAKLHIFLIFLTSSFVLHQSFFSPKSIHSKKQQQQQLLSSLQQSSIHIQSEEDAMDLMFKARDCAFSDVCSADDAKFHLGTILQVQSGCVGGTLEGQELCHDVVFASKVVSQLRSKIEKDESSSVFMEKTTASTSKDFLNLSAVMILVFMIMMISRF